MYTIMLFNAQLEIMKTYILLNPQFAIRNPKL